MKTVNTSTLIIVVILLLFAFSHLFRNQRDALKEQTYLMEALQDSLQTSKNKEGQHVAKISVLETERTKDFLQLESKDEEIKDLQALARNYRRELKKQGSVTQIGVETRIDTVFQTIVTPRDTLNNLVYPQYDFNVNLDNWIVGNGSANKDSTTLNLLLKNDYNVVVGRENNGLFKRSTPFVEVTNLNPYTETKTLRTYQVSVPKPKRLGIGFSGGVNQQLQPYVGVGVNYNLIEIK